MRIASKRDYQSSFQILPTTNEVKRRRIKSPLRSLPPPSGHSRQDDGVPFLCDDDADIAVSLFPRNFDINDDDEISCFILSLAEEREVVLMNQNEDSDQSIVDSMRSFPVDTSCGAVSSPSVSSSTSCRLYRRARFASELVSGVMEIPSHRSLTVKEKGSAYRDMRTLHTEAAKACLEIKFERSPYCPEKALEEEYFFRNRRGELVHPAHWAAFVNDIVPSLAIDPSVPHGFSSLEEYVDHLFAYERLYDTAAHNNVFASPQL